MYKIILSQLKKVINNLFYDSRQADLLYKEIMFQLHKTSTFSNLYLTKKLIIRYKNLMVMYDYPANMVTNHTKINNIWNLKYKLWKRRD